MKVRILQNDGTYETIDFHPVGDGIVPIGDGILLPPMFKAFPEGLMEILHNTNSDLHMRFSTQQDRNNFMKWLSTEGKRYYLRTMELNDQSVVEFTNYDYDVGMIATKVRQDAVE